MSHATRVPFAAALAPFVARGREALARECGTALALFAPEATATLESALLQFLSLFSLPVLDQELALREGLDGRFPWDAEARSGAAYERYVEELSRGGLDELLRHYPLLGETIATWSGNWARAHARLAHRLVEDWPSIRERFAIDDAEPRIAAITPYRSDLHHGAQSVAFVRLGGGALLVYKPRPLAMEEAFGALLAWVNGRGFSRPFAAPAVLARREHGWMEYVPATPCDVPAEVAAFYARAGGLLYLLALLQATDIHYENLIASGEHPFAVDVETLFQPREESAGFAALLAQTGMLPQQSGPDFSAFGAVGPVETPFAVTDYSETGAPVPTRFRVPQRDNVPRLRGRLQVAADHVESIAAGFEEMGRLVARNRAGLGVHVARLFAGKRCRLLARSSHFYGRLLQRSLQPPLMRDPALREALFEGLGDAEVRALRQMDVPYLTVGCDESARGRPSALAQVLERIASVSEGDLPSHLQLVRRALAKKNEAPLQAAAR